MFQLVGRRGLQASLLELEPLMVQTVKRNGAQPVGVGASGVPACRKERTRAQPGGGLYYQ